MRTSVAEHIDLTIEDATAAAGTSMHLRSHPRASTKEGVNDSAIKAEHELPPSGSCDVSPGADTLYTKSAFAIPPSRGEPGTPEQRAPAVLAQTAEGSSGRSPQEGLNNSIDPFPRMEARENHHDDRVDLDENQQPIYATASRQAEVPPAAATSTSVPMAYVQPSVTEIDDEQIHTVYSHGTEHSRPSETFNELFPGSDALWPPAAARTDCTATEKGKPSTRNGQSEFNGKISDKPLQKSPGGPSRPARPAVEFIIIHSRSPYWRAESWSPRGKFMRTSLPELILELPPTFVDALSKGSGLKFTMTGIDSSVEQPIVHGRDHTFEVMKARRLKDAYERHKSITDTGNFGQEQVPPFTIEIEVLENHFIAKPGALDKSEDLEDDIC